MSYDLVFAPSTVGHAVEPDEDGARTPPPAQVWRRLVDRAIQLLGPVHAILTETYGELDHEPTGIQLILTASSARITVPYGASGDDANTVLRQLYALGAIVEEETGLTGYDPQVGRPLREAAQNASGGQASFDLVGDMLRRSAETQRRAAQRRAEKERGR